MRIDKQTISTCYSTYTITEQYVIIHNELQNTIHMFRVIIAFKQAEQIKHRGEKRAENTQTKHFRLARKLSIWNLVLHGKIDQTFVNSLQGRLTFEIGEIDCRVIKEEYITHVHWVHMWNLICNTLVHVLYSRVSGQYLHTIKHTKTNKQIKKL